MLLQWTQSTPFIHNAKCSHSEHLALKLAIEQCIEKACSLLVSNIQNDSLYLLFEWFPDVATLSVVVTDSSKMQDAPYVIECQFTLSDNNADMSEQIQYWIRDYLTTCASFMQYSLVAAFHSQGREHSVLL
ncbi:hypothetical protein [Marinagarivorans algicola]|uniref:hypothetical protein n=1 Tax=Marinagarivorans algicola TaxID=1513270 RepID=UPI0006B9BE80|nr:hypothetical protein [Marinagarivorans algicola]